MLILNCVLRFIDVDIKTIAAAATIIALAQTLDLTLGIALALPLILTLALARARALALAVRSSSPYLVVAVVRERRPPIPAMRPTNPREALQHVIAALLIQLERIPLVPGCCRLRERAAVSR